jgi:REP-associated tyrosine transposase
MNRGVRRLRLFDGRDDYELFVRCLLRSLDRESIRLYAYCLMPNHFHLVLGPERDGQLARFMRILTGSHSQAWHRMHQAAGGGALYRGRYRACPVQTSVHFLTVCRYVERNALRAGLVTRAEDWPWGSAARYCNNCDPVPRSTWPILQPSEWLTILNTTEPRTEVADIRRCTTRGLPLGDRDWQALAIRDLALKSKLRGRGRPRTGSEKAVGSLFT